MKTKWQEIPLSTFKIESNELCKTSVYQNFKGLNFLISYKH